MAFEGLVLNTKTLVLVLVVWLGDRLLRREGVEGIMLWLFVFM